MTLMCFPLELVNDTPSFGGGGGGISRPSASPDAAANMPPTVMASHTYLWQNSSPVIDGTSTHRCFVQVCCRHATVHPVHNCEDRGAKSAPHAINAHITLPFESLAIFATQAQGTTALVANKKPNAYLNSIVHKWRETTPSPKCCLTGSHPIHPLPCCAGTAQGTNFLKTPASPSSGDCTRIPFLRQMTPFIGYSGSATVPE